jgi:RHS repeat-associated protein
VYDPQATNAPGWQASTYQYSATIPHAVTSVAIENGGTNTYSYDANGNMTCRIENGVTYTHTYNAENRASSIAKRNGDCATGTILESWAFGYDGDGTRIAIAHFTGTSGTPDSWTMYFMGGAYELKDNVAKKYYSIAGMTVAVNDGTAVQYLLTDHLGSTVAVTNASGTLTSQQRYLPFGAARTIPNSPIAGTDFTYTGQRKLDDGMGGIMDYKARFYSPYINRFLQPDSIIPNPANPQSLNRFGYVLNNPIRFNDPTGHVCSDPEDPTPSCESSGGEKKPKVRVFYFNGLGGEANNDLIPDLDPENEYQSTMYWISQRYGDNSLIHIPLFTHPYKKGLAHLEMFGEAFGFYNYWSNKALEAILSELYKNPLQTGENLIFVGSSAGGTVAAELLNDLERKGIFVNQLILRGSPVIELNLTNAGRVDYITSENPLDDHYYSVDVNPFDAVQVQEHRISGLDRHVPHGLGEMNKIGSLIVDLIKK